MLTAMAFAVLAAASIPTASAFLRLPTRALPFGAQENAART